MEDSGGIIIVLSLLGALGMVMFLTSQRRHAPSLAGKSDRELMAMATGAPVIYLLPVLEVLRDRRAAIDWALPILMRLAASTDRDRSRVGWTGLGLYFAEDVSGLHLSNPTPTDSDRLWIREWLETHPHTPDA